jgi:hypothetical protein
LNFFPKKDRKYFSGKNQKLFSEKISELFSQKISKTFFWKKLRNRNFFFKKTPKFYLSEIEVFSKKKNHKVFSGQNQELS